MNLVEQITAQILASTQKQGGRIRDEYTQNLITIEQALYLAYLSGANQATSFLVRNDGLFTPQILEQALKMTGERFGFHLTPSTPRTPPPSPL